MSSLPPAEVLNLQVTGMTCTGCAAGLQRALEALPEVTSASVSFAAGLATVQGPGLDSASILRTVEARGFSATLQTEESCEDPGSVIERQQAAHERTWRRRAIVGMALWVPLEIFHWVSSAMHWHPAWMPWIMFAASLVIIVFAGSEFYKSAWKAAVRGTTNMDTLISLGATTAFVYSCIVFFLELPQPSYFAEAAGLLGIVSLGHWLEARASAHAGSAVRELLRLQPETAEVTDENGATRLIPSRHVAAGATLLIRPGSRIPVDGEVIDGQSAVNESIVTGESLPVEKAAGSKVFAGSVNLNGRLLIRTTVDGRSTTVSRIAELVQKAQTSRAPVQRLADQISAVFVPVVLLISLLTFAGWAMSGNWSKGVISAVTVLIISCPCALGLATPMAVMVGTGAASQKGILIRSAETLERLGRARQVAFDKTGTLTIGEPQVTSILPESGYSEDQLLTLAAAVEAPSEHPLARAIVREAALRDLKLPPVDQFSALPGAGVTGRVNGQRVQVEKDEAATARVLVDGVRAGRLNLTDQVRADARRAIDQLNEMEIAVTLLSGDRSEVAAELGRQLGISSEQIIAEATPESKASWIRNAGQNVIMVGDGLNDSAALATSGVGIALASGTNIAMEAAAVVIPGDRVTAVPELLMLSRATLRTIRQNLAFAFLYNSLAIPAAAFGLLGNHGPLIAAMAMGLSDITVIGNALRLRQELRKG